VPPKRQTGKADANAKQIDAASSSALSLANPISFESNSQLVQTLQENLAIIFDHEEFKKITEVDPLGIDEGGKQAAFSQESYTTAMKNTGSYKSAGNFWWLDHLFNPVPGTPLSAARIRQYQDFKFRDPCTVPFDIIAAVPHVAFNPLEHRGLEERYSN
jgi:hypothetical protein